MSKKRRKSKIRPVSTAKSGNTANVASTNVTKEGSSVLSRKAYDKIFMREYELVLMEFGIEEESLESTIEKLEVVTKLINRAYVTGGRNLKNLLIDVSEESGRDTYYLQCDLKKEINMVLGSFHRRYGELIGPVIRKRIFGDPYADMSDPETFVFGIADYLARN